MEYIANLVLDKPVLEALDILEKIFYDMKNEIKVACANAGFKDQDIIDSFYYPLQFDAGFNIVTKYGKHYLCDLYDLEHNNIKEWDATQNKNIIYNADDIYDARVVNIGTGAGKDGVYYVLDIEI